MARTHVVMSDKTLEAIDEVVGKRGRSRFLEEAATEKLERIALVDALHASAGIARGQAYTQWRDQSVAASWVRDVRRTEPNA